MAGIYSFVTEISLLEWGKGLIFSTYFLGSIWFFADKKSPISEWAETHPFYSVPIWFFLMIVGCIVIL